MYICSQISFVGQLSLSNYSNSRITTEENLNQTNFALDSSISFKLFFSSTVQYG